MSPQSVNEFHSYFQGKHIILCYVINDEQKHYLFFGNINDEQKHHFWGGTPISDSDSTIYTLTCDLFWTNKKQETYMKNNNDATCRLVHILFSQLTDLCEY